jgi:hypothetical protein
MYSTTYHSRIKNALAPASRITASKSLAPTYPFLAADGNDGSSWISGGVAPQWIQLDLGGTRLVSQVNLTVAQSSMGRTTHIVEAQKEGEINWRAITTFDQVTQDGQKLSFRLSVAGSYRYIRVNTTRSPSWVAWKEIWIE